MKNGQFYRSMIGPKGCSLMVINEAGDLNKTHLFKLFSVSVTSFLSSGYGGVDISYEGLQRKREGKLFLQLQGRKVGEIKLPFCLCQGAMFWSIMAKSWDNIESFSIKYHVIYSYYYYFYIQVVPVGLA